MLLLDNQYTVELLLKNSIFTRVWAIYDSTILKGTGGTIKITQKYILMGYGKVWFDEQSITNILVLNNFNGKFRVTYENSNAGFFTVHNPRGKDAHYKIHKYRLHYKNNKNHHVTIVQTVNNNEASYIKHQLNSAKLSRGIYENVAHLSQNDFKKLFKSNLIINCPVTLEDATRDEKINGTTITGLKGKTIWTRTYTGVTEYITAP